MASPKFGTCSLCSRKDIPVRKIKDKEENELLVCKRCLSKLSKDQIPSKKISTPEIRKRELPDLEQFEPPPKVYTKSQKDEIIETLSRNVQDFSDKVKKSVRDANLKEKLKIPPKLKDKFKRKQ